MAIYHASGWCYYFYNNHNGDLQNRRNTPQYYGDPPFWTMPTGTTGKSVRTGPSKNRWWHCGRLSLSGSSILLDQFRSMSDFGFPSTSSSSPSGGMNGTQRAELMEQVQSQLLVATLQEMLAVSFHEHDEWLASSCRYMCMCSRSMMNFELIPMWCHNAV